MDYCKTATILTGVHTDETKITEKGEYLLESIDFSELRIKNFPPNGALTLLAGQQVRGSFSTYEKYIGGLNPSLSLARINVYLKEGLGAKPFFSLDDVLNSGLLYVERLKKDAREFIIDQLACVTTVPECFINKADLVGLLEKHPSVIGSIKLIDSLKGIKAVFYRLDLEGKILRLATVFDLQIIAKSTDVIRPQRIFRPDI